MYTRVPPTFKARLGMMDVSSDADVTMLPVDFTSVMTGILSL